MKEAVAFDLWFTAIQPDDAIQTRALRVQAVSQAEAERMGREIAQERGLKFEHAIETGRKERDDD